MGLPLQGGKSHKQVAPKLFLPQFHGSGNLLASAFYKLKGKLPLNYFCHSWLPI